MCYSNKEQSFIECIEENIKNIIGAIFLYKENEVRYSQDKLKERFNQLIDSENEEIVDTPHRVAKMLANDIFVGLNKNNFPEYKMFNIDKEYNEPIVVEDISIYSICEHHFLPFIGKAKFSYIPKDKIIGLSKIPRIIDFLSRKPQLQEKLTLEIFNKFKEILGTEDICVELKCEHLCAKMRGIKDNCLMTTTKRGGVFNKKILTDNSL